MDLKHLDIIYVYMIQKHTCMLYTLAGVCISPGYNRLSGTERVVDSRILELLCWKLLTAAAKNRPMRAMRVNQNSEVVGQTAKMS